MLPYTAEAFFAQVEQYNRDIWPSPLIAGLLGLFLLGLVLRPASWGASWGGRLTAGLLAIAWLWTGIAWHVLTFSLLNFAAPVYGAFFVIQGLLLGWRAMVDKTFNVRFQPDAAGWVGLGLCIAALLLYPFVDGLTTGAWTSLRVTGVTPAPTAAFTLGLLLLSEGRVRWHLAVVPLLWIVVAGATGWILNIPQDVALAIIGLLVIGVMIRKNSLKR